jgi:hypothetical protein
VCCDGLSGLPESIAAVWPAAVIQTCVVHLLRSCMRYASYTDRKEMATALRPIYTGATEEDAKLAIEAFRAEWKAKSPGAVASGRGWAEFVPFLAFLPEIRRIIYTTNAIESLNYQLRKVTTARGSFPSDAAAMKLRYLALRNINQKRGSTRARNLPLDRSAEHLRDPIPRPAPVITQKSTAAKPYTVTLTSPGGARCGDGPKTHCRSGRPAEKPRQTKDSNRQTTVRPRPIQKNVNVRSTKFVVDLVLQNHEVSPDELRSLLDRHARPDMATAIDGVRICKFNYPPRRSHRCPGQFWQSSPKVPSVSH